MSAATKATHTPGPWRINPYAKADHNYTIYPATNFLGIGRVNVRQTTREQDEANARLIAAAPEMLEALEEIYRLVDVLFVASRVHGTDIPKAHLAEIRDTASAVIRKVQGEQ